MCIDGELQQVTHSVRVLMWQQKAAALVSRQRSRCCRLLVPACSAASCPAQRRRPALAPKQGCPCPASLQRQHRGLSNAPGRLRASLPSWLHMPSLGALVLAAELCCVLARWLGGAGHRLYPPLPTCRPAAV